MPHTTTTARLSGGLVLAAALAGFGATTAQAAPAAGATTAVTAITTVAPAAPATDTHGTLSAAPAPTGATTTTTPAFTRGTGVTPTHLGVAAGGGVLVGLTALATRGVRRARVTDRRSSRPATGRGGA